jgi:hypothetical protein
MDGLVKLDEYGDWPFGGSGVAGITLFRYLPASPERYYPAKSVGIIRTIHFP